MLEMTRDSSSCDFARGAGAGVDAGVSACVCREKEGRRSQDDQDEEDCCGGAGVAACGSCGVAGAAPAAWAARACWACCSQSSRVLSSTGHLAASPSGDAPPRSFMVAVPVAVLLFPCAVAPLRPTNTVSRRSVCMMRSPAGWETWLLRRESTVPSTGAACSFQSLFGGAAETGRPAGPQAVGHLAGPCLTRYPPDHSDMTIQTTTTHTYEKGGPAQHEALECPKARLPATEALLSTALSVDDRDAHTYSVVQCLPVQVERCGKLQPIAKLLAT